MNRKIILWLVCSMLLGSLAWMLAISGGASVRAHARNQHLSTGHLADPPTSSIAIFISGSTNHPCTSTLFINAAGIVTTSSCNLTQTKSIPKTLTASFFNDVIKALPFSTPPKVTGCYKSISFGTTIIVVYNKSVSSDVSCPSDELGQKIYDDVLGIQNAIHTTPAPTPIPPHFLPIHANPTPTTPHYPPIHTLLTPSHGQNLSPLSMGHSRPRPRPNPHPSLSPATTLRGLVTGQCIC